MEVSSTLWETKIIINTYTLSHETLITTLFSAALWKLCSIKEDNNEPFPPYLFLICRDRGLVLYLGDSKVYKGVLMHGLTVLRIWPELCHYTFFWITAYFPFHTWLPTFTLNLFFSLGPSNSRYCGAKTNSCFTLRLTIQLHLASICRPSSLTVALLSISLFK